MAGLNGKVAPAQAKSAIKNKKSRGADGRQGVLEFIKSKKIPGQGAWGGVSENTHDPLGNKEAG